VWKAQSFRKERQQFFHAKKNPANFLWETQHMATEVRTRPDRLIERYRRAQHPQQLPHYAPYNKKQASSFLS
jgi:hypothetical protein